MKLPIFLKDYDIDENLSGFIDLFDQGKASWCITSNRDEVFCDLHWTKNQQMHGISKIATTAKEAVFLAIFEFEESFRETVAIADWHSDGAKMDVRPAAICAA